MNMTSIKASQKKTSKRAIKVAKSPKATEQMWENSKYMPRKVAHNNNNNRKTCVTHLMAQD